jgi:hypothetical protein
MQIRVSRGAGDRIGDDIVDPLLTDNSVGLARGTHELNEQISVIEHEFTGPLADYINTGSIVEVSDGKRTFRGKVTYFNQTLSISPDGRTYDPKTTIRVVRMEP